MRGSCRSPSVSRLRLTAVPRLNSNPIQLKRKPMTTKPTKAPRKRSLQSYKTKRRSAAAAKAQHRLWRDPEHRAKMIAAGARSADDRRKNPQRYSRKGVPDGMRKAEAMKAWAEARTKADGIMKILEDHGAPEQAHSGYGGRNPGRSFSTTARPRARNPASFRRPRTRSGWPFCQTDPRFTSWRLRHNTARLTKLRNYHETNAMAQQIEKLARFVAETTLEQVPKDVQWHAKDIRQFNCCD